MIDLAFFLFGALVAGTIFWLQKRQGKESEGNVTSRVLEESSSTRVRIDLLEAKLVRALESSVESTQVVRQVLSDARFEDILVGIDPQGELKGGDDETAHEITKRLLFYLVREIIRFPFQAYKHFVAWLPTRGYQIPSHLSFETEELYERALTKVERLNRVGITVNEVDCHKLFSKRRPFRVPR